MHEIVTLQFGQQANYLGTHYWNTQESYFTYAGQEDSPVDHDISFRAGVGVDGSDTYAPRTVIYDLKGAFGTLRRENALYQLQNQDTASQSGPWRGSTIPLQLPPIAPSPYQQALDQGAAPPQLTTDTVRFWSDYNHLFYHPRSIVQLNEYELNSSLMPFERWQSGEELFSNLDREHDLLDRDLRPFLEECDQLQALQIFSGTDDAWGGFAAKYLERISDELGKGCRWIFGLQHGTQATRDQIMLRSANAASSLLSLNSTASLHIPLTSLPPSLPSYVALNASSPWHSSALQAAVVESVTLPTRLRRSEAMHATFDQIEANLDDNGNRRLAVASLSAADPSYLEEQMKAKGTQGDRLSNGHRNEDSPSHDSKLDVSMFPSVAVIANNAGRRLGRREHVFSRIDSLRGPWESDEELATINADARERFNSGPRALSLQTGLRFPLLPSYPHIFRFSDRPEKLAIRASLSTTTAVADEIRQLGGLSQRLTALEDREALRDGLANMAQEYEEGWSGSESDDDV